MYCENWMWEVRIKLLCNNMWIEGTDVKMEGTYWKATLENAGNASDCCFRYKTVLSWIFSASTLRYWPNSSGMVTEDSPSPWVTSTWLFGQAVWIFLLYILNNNQEASGVSESDIVSFQVEDAARCSLISWETVLMALTKLDGSLKYFFLNLKSKMVHGARKPALLIRKVVSALLILTVPRPIQFGVSHPYFLSLQIPSEWLQLGSHYC